MDLFPYDFYHFWAAGYIARHGGNPYQVAEIKRIMLTCGWPETEAVFGFLHPFSTLWLFSLFSYLPFPVAKIVWEGLIVILIVVSVSLLNGDRMRQELGLSSPTSFLAFASILFPPAVSTLQLGQTKAFLLFGIVGWLFFYTRKRFFFAGIMLSLTTLNPQLFLFFYLWIFLFHLRDLEMLLIAGFSFGFLGQVGSSIAFAPHSPVFWYDAMLSVSQAAIDLPTASFSRLLIVLTGFQQAQHCLLILGLLAVILGLRRWRQMAAHKGLLLFLPLSMLISPYTWSAAFLPLLPVHLVFLSSLNKVPSRATVYGIFIFALLGILEMARPYYITPFMALLPLNLLIFGLWYPLRPNSYPHILDAKY
jgi:hypothetical protein